MTEYRREATKRVREAAAQLAFDREHPVHQANGDEQTYAQVNYAMSFTKGLDHDNTTGLVKDPSDFEAFRSAIDSGFAEPFTSRVPVPTDKDRRVWEAPTAGVVFELEGPDPQAVTMPPAPPLCSDELTFEMAEVYELALLRDEPLNAFDAGGGSAKLTDAIARLNALPYAQQDFPGRPRTTGPGGNLNAQTVFRGASPGVDRGPYLSQLMLIGNPGPGGVTPADGFVAFGAQRVDQRVLEALPGKDYVMAWDDWRAIQQGYAIQGVGQEFTGNTRFIHTVRDLATYVHIDALYQAYLNACLILLGNGTPFDPSFALLSGRGRLLIDAVSGARMPYNAGGFALWGGPHILSLVTEVATRGLKAVRYQKFNNHIRLRPEALAARMERAAEIEEAFPSACGCFSDMANALDSVISQVRLNNQARANESTALLPMAFEEGSPMHPAYGAGHATVAGACVTMLKAFFDTSAVFVRVDGNAGFHDHAQIVQALKDGAAVEVGAYQSVDDGKCLDFTGCGEYVLEGKGDKAVARFKADRARGHCCPLTLEGELNKLAANVSIGRNMAGVHYFSDYFDSVRMGEEIAIGILEEQALGYTTDPFVLSVPTFDGQTRRVGAR